MLKDKIEKIFESHDENDEARYNARFFHSSTLRELKRYTDNELQKILHSYLKRKEYTIYLGQDERDEMIDAVNREIRSRRQYVKR